MWNALDIHTRERDSLPLDVDGITALLADKTGKRDTLSPQLKDKYIQRLRTLRKRLQALKELRTWPVPGTTNAESSSSGVREIYEETTPVEEPRPDRPQDFRTTTIDSGTIHEPSADALAGAALSGTIRESKANLLEGVAADSGVGHAEALGADSLGSAVPPTGVTTGAGGRIPGGSDVGRQDGAAREEHASSVDRNTAELDLQLIQPGEEGARGADNQHGEARRTNGVFLHPSQIRPLTQSSGEHEGSEAKLGTGEPGESVEVPRRENSARVLVSGGDYLPKGETLSSGLGDNTHGVRQGGETLADMPLSGGGGARNAAGPTDARAHDRTDIEHPQDKPQQVLMLHWVTLHLGSAPFVVG